MPTRLVGAFIFLGYLFGQPAVASTPPLPCGTYTSSGSIFQTLIFEDAGLVTLSMPGHQQRSNFVQHGNLISIKSDDDFLLLRQDNNKLVGLDIWTKDRIYRRSNPPAVACQTPPAPRTHAHNSCHKAARELHKTSTLSDSLSRFEFCCSRGDSASCNTLGALSIKAHKKLSAVEHHFKKACDMGHGPGCANLANIALRKGNPEKATRIRTKACHFEHKQSCIDLALIKNKPPTSSD